MNETIKEKLLQVSDDYTQYHLRRTFYDTLTPRERDKLADDLLRFLNPIVMAGALLTEDEKVRMLYETLSRCLRYDHSDDTADTSRLRYTYAGGIANGKAVCMGIAELYTLLGNALGLEVQTVIGYGGDPAHKGGLHAWNLVWLRDGSRRIPYHIDLTWDLADNAAIRGFRYYLKSDAFMRDHDHTWLEDRYPPCPENRSGKQIPKIPPAAIQFLSEQFRTLQRGSHKT